MVPPNTQTQEAIDMSDYLHCGDHIPDVCLCPDSSEYTLDICSSLNIKYTAVKLPKTFFLFKMYKTGGGHIKNQIF